jgi:branched-chain amino acid transport system ATP-binding protein
MGAMLRIDHLDFAYGDLQVLWDVSIDVNQGEIVTVVGANGAGKSTTLRNVSRLARPRSGTITFEGTVLNRIPSHKVVELGLVQVPEARRIFPEMTVTENLRMGSFVKTVRKDRDRNMERVFALFPRLAERRSQLGGTMSGGEQQMLAIGRGLMANPRLLLLDEPSLGLSPLLTKEIFGIIRRLNAEQGVTMLLVEQNANMALKTAHYGYVLETGRIVLEGACDKLAQNEDVREFYLGQKETAVRGKKRWKRTKRWR